MVTKQMMQVFSVCCVGYLEAYEYLYLCLVLKKLLQEKDVW